MEAGLDEVIESLLTEIAFSGHSGCTVSSLLSAIDSFYKTAPSEADGDSDTQRLDVASQVWRWMADRPDVSVGENRRLNHKSLDEILSMPEEEVKPALLVQPHPDDGTFRPRLHVAEERQWKTITGHSPDFKRVPLFEWRALVDIASVKKEGILQGDLVRLTGQDKRSLPNRTDALAKKGYIVKQPYFDKGFRTSKLWLMRFAQDAKAEEARQGLDFSRLDLSKATLTKDLDPVPFHEAWSRQPIDYMALAQAFVAVMKAWGLMRYGDARVKMGVEIRVPLMRALAKTCRWLAGIGCIQFVAARFSGSSKLFKDCVKYMREPTASEWAEFRATPKAHLTMPSERLRAVGSSTACRGPRPSKGKENEKQKEEKTPKPPKSRVARARITPLPWKPQTPIVNASFDLMKRAGSYGSTNASIGMQTLGEGFSRYTAALNRSMSTPVNIQPPHLDHLSAVSKLTRFKKTVTYQYFAKSEMPPTTDDAAPQTAAAEVESSAPADSADDVVMIDDGSFFSQPNMNMFSRIEHPSLTKIAKTRHTTNNLLIRKKGGLNDEDRPGSTRKGRPPKKKASGKAAVGETEEHSQVESTAAERLASEEQEATEDSQATGQQQAASEPERLLETEPAREVEPERPPGVYKGKPNSLDRIYGRKGRPRKSVVVIFRSDKLKDASFLGIVPAASEAAGASGPSPSTGTPAKSKISAFKMKGSLFQCEKCGNTWKNSNGLEYHLNKARNACNPNWTPPPPAVATLRREPINSSGKPTESRGLVKNVSRRTPLDLSKIRFRSQQDASVASTKHNPSVKSSRINRTATGPSNESPSGPQSARGGVKLKELQVYDATDHRQMLKLPSFRADAEQYSNADQRQQAANSRKTHKTKSQKDRRAPSSQTPSRVSSGTSDLNDTPKARRPLPTARKPLPAVESQTDSSPVPVVEKVPRASGPRPFSAFEINTRAGASFNARRRDRTMQTIAYLLEHNKDVFPGNRSLFMALLSVWVKEVTDLGPPDRRALQNFVNQMEREGKVKQVHFFFLDDKGKMQEHSVLVKPDPSNPKKDVSLDPRVVALKQKLREMHPEAYVPARFALSPDEVKLFNEIGPDPSQSNRIYKSLRLRERIQDIEILNYDAPVTEGPSPEPSTAETGLIKRPGEELGADVQRPIKRARSSQTDAVTPKRRYLTAPGMHGIWDSGKLASYIWSERQKGGPNKGPRVAGLGNVPATAPGDLAAEQSGVTTLADILASVKTPRQIDASVRRQGRDSWIAADIHASSGEDDGFDDENEHDLLPAHVYYQDARGKSPDPFIHVYVPETTSPDSPESDEGHLDFLEERNEELDQDQEQGHEIPAYEVKFAPVITLGSKIDGYWGDLHDSFFESRDHAGFAIEGPLPSEEWFFMENLPRSTDEIMQRDLGRDYADDYADSPESDFLRRVNTIERWELSREGRKLKGKKLKRGDIYINVHSTAPELEAGPTGLEWLEPNQYTPDTLPDEIKTYSDHNHDVSTERLPRFGRNPEKQKKQRKIRKLAMKQEQEWYEYKTRTLTAIPKQSRSRVNKPALHDHRLGARREDELIAAFVIFKTLLGGLERCVDYGLMIKIFPSMSLSAIRKFWPRVSKERRSYCDALTAKFQSAFLEAYESGEIAPIDYENLESYDWPALIVWTANLETHEEIDLPESRQILGEVYDVADAQNEAGNWKEIWFGPIQSVYSRLEAIASEAVAIPLRRDPSDETATLNRARTWVRSLCCTSLRGVNVRDKVVPKLLELGGGEIQPTNKILIKVVKDLNERKVIVRYKGKDLGGNFRLHANFAKQMNKMTSTQKFLQASAFKMQLDDFALRGEEYVLPYASDDGTIMAILNLQSHGHVKIEPIDVPDIPFGFEPGNYESRFFPKSYYHFRLRVVPTETYLTNRNMPLLRSVEHMQPPVQGPDDEIPIWVDFFGNINYARWADYVCMITFALATKGPFTPKTCASLLNPMVEEFEVDLVTGWLDKLGLLLRAVDGIQVTVAEWWWLVAAHLVKISGISDERESRKKVSTRNGRAVRIGGD